MSILEIVVIDPEGGRILEVGATPRPRLSACFSNPEGVKYQLPKYSTLSGLRWYLVVLIRGRCPRLVYPSPFGDGMSRSPDGSFPISLLLQSCIPVDDNRDRIGLFWFDETVDEKSFPIRKNIIFPHHGSSCKERAHRADLQA